NAPTGTLGETVRDTATVAASPFTATGTVTYTFYHTLTGTGTPLSTQTVTLTGTGGVPDSSVTAALTAGSYSYIAIYSGDGNYNASTGSVEPLTINKANTTTATVIKDGSTANAPTGVLGEAVRDTATVAASPFTATGTVTYQFYTTINGTGAHTDQTVTLTGTGGVPDSSVTAALTAGSY